VKEYQHRRPRDWWLQCRNTNSAGRAVGAGESEIGLLEPVDPSQHCCRGPARGRQRGLVLALERPTGRPTGQGSQQEEPEAAGPVQQGVAQRDPGVRATCEWTRPTGSGSWASRALLAQGKNRRREQGAPSRRCWHRGGREDRRCRKDHPRRPRLCHCRACHRACRAWRPPMRGTRGTC